MSVLSKAPRPSGDDVKRVALAALAAALENGNQQQEKPAKRSGPMKGVRTLAAGAALYVAGRAAYKNRDALMDQIQGDEDDEPEAEEDEDFEDEEEEPEAEEDEDFDEDFDDEEEPAAEEDEDFYDEDDEGVNPVDRPPEPPEAEEDEDRTDARREAAGRR